MSNIFDNPNFQPMDRVAGKPTISVTKNGVGFSKQTLSMLAYSHYVQIYINKVDKQLAIRACEKDDPNSIKFVSLNKEKTDSLRWNNPVFTKSIRGLVSTELENDNFVCEGVYLDDDKAMLFDFTKAVHLDIKGS